MNFQLETRTEGVPEFDEELRPFPNNFRDRPVETGVREALDGVESGLIHSREDDLLVTRHCEYSRVISSLTALQSCYHHDNWKSSEVISTLCRMDGLGDYVKAKRELLGISATDLAVRTGMSLAYLSQIESGTRKWPQKYISALARELHVPEPVLAMYAGKVKADPRQIESARNEMRANDPQMFERIAEISETLSPADILWMWESLFGGNWDVQLANAGISPSIRAHDIILEGDDGDPPDEPLTESELDELQNVVFTGLNDLSPKQLRDILKIIRSQ